MNPDPRLIEAIFAMYNVRGPWEHLPATGLANHIYATQDVVLRVATDHPDGIVDARTESVAARVVRATGILTPALIAFDDSRTLVDRPFSLWERVHGETLGLVDLEPRQRAEAWRQVGRELSRLHDRVRVCPDPNGYLDDPGREPDRVDALLKRLVDAQTITAAAAGEVERLAAELRSHVTSGTDLRFVHNDLHSMNVMCSISGALLAIIDWGDAGWGDPTLDFAAIPLDVLPEALDGYESETPGALGEVPDARITWDQLCCALKKTRQHPELAIPVETLRGLLRRQ